MIQILIVEDNPHKLNNIIRVLKDDLMINENCIHSALSVTSAKKRLKVDCFDLLILDLVIPINEGENPNPENGIGFLSDINVSPILNAPIHIIGMTEHVNFQSDFEENFSDYLWHLIQYNASETEWQDKLKHLVNHLLSIKNSFIKKMKEEFNYDIAIITALYEPEFEQILKLPLNWNQLNIPNDATKYYSGIIENNKKKLKIIAACTGQMGMPATSSLSTKIILTFQPKYIFMAGICAGLKDKELHFGDIIIAEQSWDYGSGKMKDTQNEENITILRFEAEPKPIQLSLTLKQKINNFILDKNIISTIQNEWQGNKSQYVLKALSGPVASGSYVVASANILDEIKSHNRKLLGVEMEGYGLYLAADVTANQQTKAIMIKSVSDFGDSNKADNYQMYAAYTSAKFIYYFIKHELV